MADSDLSKLQQQKGMSPLRLKLAAWVESKPIQLGIILLIVLNSIILGLETDSGIMARFGGLLIALDKLCLAIFCVELLIKLFAYRLRFWTNGWNIFDFLVIAVALIPGAGPLAVLRSLRILRVLRLLTAVPSLKKVVAAFIHSIPSGSAPSVPASTPSSK
ncbi:ion transporter [Akkermansiaceae bacterium]|nr:ion transporter [Akkermansiaceae bacterium]